MSTTNIIEYKNYLAELMLDTEDNIIVGRVINTADIPIPLQDARLSNGD